MLLRLAARSIWNRENVGLASDSSCWIANADSYAFNASPGLPVLLSRLPMLLWLAARSLLELREGGVGLGQLLLDRQRRLIRLQRLARLAGVAQQDADVIVAGRQGSLELGDGGVGVGQLLPDLQRFSMC